MARKSWSIPVRIAIAISLIIAGATLAISLVELVALSSMSNLRSASLHYGPITNAANQFETEILNARISFIYYVTIQKPGSVESGYQRYANARQKLKDLQDRPKIDGQSDVLEPVIAQLSSAFDKYDVELNGILKAVQSGVRSGPEYDALVKNWAAAGGTLVKTSAQLRDAAANCSEEAEKQASDRLKLAITLASLIMVFGSASGVVIAYWATRSIKRDLDSATVSLEQGAEQLASAAAQVASSSQALAQGASESAASVEETSSSTHQISAITQQNVAKAKDVAGCAERCRSDVLLADTKLQEMVVASKESCAASDRIAKIIKVVDDIAFQTNILALNAAVEAARAGSAGAGFAVVADEVRNLAQRSATAAKETSELIETALNKNKESTSKVEEVKAAMGNIISEVVQVKELADEVAAASTEQSVGLNHVSEAVTQIERVTQNNAANAEENAAAGEELNAQASSLGNLVASLQVLVGARRTAVAQHFVVQSHAPRKSTTRALPNTTPLHQDASSDGEVEWMSL